MRDDEQESTRLRAYEIWEREGRPEGQHESHWHEALKELGLVAPYDAGAVQGAGEWDDEEA